jgi:hypothetical protein
MSRTPAASCPRDVAAITYAPWCVEGVVDRCSRARLPGWPLRIVAAGLVLLWAHRAHAQTPADRRPKALVGSWTWRGIDQSLEDHVITLGLHPDGLATVFRLSAEELASGAQPKGGLLKWWVEYPAWPDRQGRQLCLQVKQAKAGCHVYSILGARPRLRLVYADRTWEWAKKP